MALACARRLQPSVASAGERAPDGLVVVADAQTAGRGRRGRTWFSPPGSGLYVSVVLAPATARVDPLRATMLLTLAAGVALAEGDRRRDRPRRCRSSGRTICSSGGASSPASSPRRADRHVVVGYGINVASAAFPPELRDRATSLESELGRLVDRHHVLVETLAALSRRYDDLLDGRFDAILDAWRRRAPAASGARVTWTTMAGTQSGVTAGIDDQGALLVQVGDRDRAHRVGRGDMAVITEALDTESGLSFVSFVSLC